MPAFNPLSQYGIACFSAFADSVFQGYTPCEYLRCQNGKRAAFSTTLS